MSLLQFLLDIGLPDGRQQGRRPVHMRHNLVRYTARLDLARPAHHRRHAETAFPAGVLLAAERGHAGVRPGVHVRTVVGAVHHYGVISNAQFVECVENRAHVLVVVDHGIVIV